MKRESIGSDIFFPSDPEDLRSIIDGSLELSYSPAGSCGTIIVPHGEYGVTAPLAGAAWKAASRQQASLILLLLPVHSPVSSQNEGLWIPSLTVLSSPLGEVPVSNPLTKTACFREDHQYVWEEPALDTALPYISVLFPGIPVLPVFCAGHTSRVAASLEELISHLSTLSVLFVVSSNMSGHEPPETAQAHLDAAVSLLTATDRAEGHEPLLEPWRRGRVSMCNPASLEALRRGVMKGRSYRLLGHACSPEHLDRITAYASFAG